MGWLRFVGSLNSVHTDVLQIVNSELQEMRKMIVELQKEARTGSSPVTALGKKPVTKPCMMVAPANIVKKNTSQEHNTTHKRLDVRIDLPVVPRISQDGVDGLASHGEVSPAELDVLTQALKKDKNLGLYCSYDMRTESSPGSTAMVYSQIDTIEKLLVKFEKSSKSTIFFPTKIHKQKPEVGEIMIAVSKKDEPIIIYAGILDFPISVDAEQKQLIAHDILTGITVPLLCSKYPSFFQANEAATHLSTKGLQPLYWCTGEDGFCVSWRDPACFLRCGDGLDVSNRVVQIFLPEYVGENCFETIKGKCVLARGIQKSLTHAPGSSLSQYGTDISLEEETSEQTYGLAVVIMYEASHFIYTICRCILKKNVPSAGHGPSPPRLTMQLNMLPKYEFSGHSFLLIFHRVLTSASAVYRAPHCQKHTSSRMA